MTKQALPLALIAIFAGVGAFLTVQYAQAIESANAYELYSFFAQILIGVILALIFWYFQSIDGQKMHELLERQDKLNTDVHNFIIEQKRIRDSIRKSTLGGIGYTLK